MKALGAVLLICGMLMLLCGIACLFASTSPFIIGVSILLSVVLNTAAITLLTSRNKK